jgi:hypothetical protein
MRTLDGRSLRGLSVAAHAQAAVPTRNQSDRRALSGSLAKGTRALGHRLHPLPAANASRSYIQYLWPLRSGLLEMASKRASPRDDRFSVTRAMRGLLGASANLPSHRDSLGSLDQNSYCRRMIIHSERTMYTTCGMNCTLGTDVSSARDRAESGFE